MDGGGALGLAATGCEEGGGHSVHPRMLNPLPEPWMPADILDDVGPQLLYSEVPDPTKPTPEKGSTIGNWHATVRCASWTLHGVEKPGLVFGYVGMKIEHPPFGDEEPAREYIVTVVAANDPELIEAFHAAGVHAMSATTAWTPMPGDWLRVQMQTDHNGAYDSLFKPKSAGSIDAGLVRLWFQKENEDGTWSPVAIDMWTTEAQHVIADGQGYFSHSGTQHHFPAPGAYGHTAALMLRGFDREWSWGPRPDVKILAYYDH
jgi:hypothetical protein